ncbi:MAG TPA: DUF1365 domain-containing protein [Nocardioidaceae bacterium]|nr:DUF1365 domain-containing protein [Nocardioidaceae bacterium]
MRPAGSLPLVPARVRAHVAHRRARPFTYAFENSTTMWLVDAADPNAAFPRWLRPLASIRSVDHFAAEDSRPLPVKIRSYLDAQGVDWSAERVLMLANARSLGYVFDPLTTYFCFDAGGNVEGVVAEVHNTYGERHAYPLQVAERQPAQVDKEFYVSPFFAVEGRYDIRTRLTDRQVAVAVSLTQGEEQVFTASVHGDLTPATLRTALTAVAANPIASQRVSALIRWHGVRLWLRKLPVVPRQPHRDRTTHREGASPR